jgi:hypothetical protein
MTVKTAPISGAVFLNAMGTKCNNAMGTVPDAMGTVPVALQNEMQQEPSPLHC